MNFEKISYFEKGILKKSEFKKKNMYLEKKIVNLEKLWMFWWLPNTVKKMYKTKNVIQALLFISANLNANN